MKKSFYLFLICGILAATLFSTCKKEVKVSGVIVEPKSLYLSKGDVTQLAYIVTPYGADNKSIKWTSEDNSVATVSTTGLVTAISEGETQITATTHDGHFSDVVAVTVMRGSPAGDSIALIKLCEVAENLPWDLTKPMNQWQGVELNSCRRVVSIIGSGSSMIFLTKSLDTSIGNLACLKQLILKVLYSATEKITIPAEIGLLTNLQRLSLYDGFTGAIPPELGNLTDLKTLEIQYNDQLKGTIPPELGNLTQLEILYIFDNPLLTGNIPKELGNLINLKELDLSSNHLTGNIPKELGNLVNLEYLSLSDNKLTGEIPKELSNLTNLKSLSLGYNRLTGDIPPELGKLTKLWRVSLPNNQLTGNIPKELGNLAYLETLYLSDNKLTGEIPQELENLTRLSWLELKHNSLSGNIPRFLLDRFYWSSFCPQNGTNFDNLDCGW